MSARVGPTVLLIALMAIGASAACARAATVAAPVAAAVDAPLQLVPRVVRVLPHDPSAFTQGLLWHEGVFLESTGLLGESELREVNPGTGVPGRVLELAEDLFGEGLARVGDRLWQITWQNGVALQYELATFAKVGEVSFDGEGWGLCFDGIQLIMSDGTARLSLRDPITFAETGELHVNYRGRALTQLNELECAEGWIYANVYGQEAIVRIDPLSGAVLATIDARGLLSAEDRAGLQFGEVLNGIAYDPGAGTFFLTGKRWPKVFEVVFVEAATSP